MSHAHDHRHEAHAHGPRPVAERPTVSLLRLSAWQRLTGAGLVVAALWLTVIATIA
jgi:hypothetical protein